MTKADLAQTIIDLEAVVGKSPKGKPPSARAWDGLTAALGAVHDDLRVFWTWGKIEALASSARIEEEREESEAFWGQVWVSPASALSTLRQLREDVPTFPVSFVPLCTDEAGNYTCFDNATGRLMDWDHETRKTKRLAKSLIELLQTIRAAYVKAAAREATDATDRAERVAETKAKATQAKGKGKGKGAESAAKAEAAGELPRTLKPMGAPILRKTEDRLHEYEDGILSPDNGRAVLRQVSQQTTFLHLSRDVREHPSIAELQDHIRMFGSADRPFSEGLAVSDDGGRFALASRDEISLWRWDEAGVSLTGRASWHDPKRKSPQFRAADLRRGGRVWLSERHLAVSIERADTSGAWDKSYGFDAFGDAVVAVWSCADLPGDTALSTKPKSVAPAHIVGAGLPNLRSFAMAGTRLVTVHEAADYGSSELRVWELGQEAPLVTKTIESGVNRVALRPDGLRCAYLGQTLTVLDAATLSVVAQATKKEARALGETLVYDPTGRLLVTASNLELFVWESERARVLLTAKIPDSKYKNGRRHFVKHVTRDRVLLVEPALLFALR